MSLPAKQEEEDEKWISRRRDGIKWDSAFLLWGGCRNEFARSRFEPESDDVVDEFLASKGWNDVDSGFRII